MTRSAKDDRVGMREKKLRWRDWILLPTLGLLTVCILAASLELIGWLTFRTSFGGPAPCIVRDPSVGLRGIANSVCWEKRVESQPVEYKFNSCGHRAGMDCRPRMPNTYRIVMTGSSFAMGSLVQRERTFAALLPVDLSQRTGRKVELYNEGLSWKTPQNVSLGFNDVLTAQPDLVIWILTPWDINGVANAPVGDSSLSEFGTRWNTIRTVMEALKRKSLPDAAPVILAAIRTRWENTESGVLLQHYLFESQSEYVKLFLMGPAAEFLRTKPDLKFQASIDEFNDYAADIEGRAKAAGVPLVAVLVPDRAQAAMVSMGKWPVGFDPYRLGLEIQSIISSHGGTYIDILPDFRSIPNPEQYYFPIDGHPTPEGHRIIADLLAKALTGGPIPSFRGTTSRSTCLRLGK